MLSHMGLYALKILEITHMAKLVDLVVSDCLDGQRLLDALQIPFGGSNCRHACAGKADLGSGGKLIYHVRAARLLTFT